LNKVPGKPPNPAERFGRLLLAWYSRGHRDLPWRNTRDPYRIWISEIMLQQTRAQAVIPYYLRFLERFPTVEALAAAEEDTVLALWSGLGYYSRARNLRLAARLIVASGPFPGTYEAIRELPGIGDYTAAAIASIAFDLPHAVLDGNVLRVVARVANDAADIASNRTRERFRAIAQEWLVPAEPGHFNQALMELGATVCLPRNPLCLVCPLADCCRARQEGAIAQVPVKLRKTEPILLDGVLTRTATVHFAAWKRTFDEFLHRHEPGQAEFSQLDYNRYVDGKHRADGVRGFLESRGITLPEGGPDDPPDAAHVSLLERKPEGRPVLTVQLGVRDERGSLPEQLEGCAEPHPQSVGVPEIAWRKTAEGPSVALLRRKPALGDQGEPAVRAGSLRDDVDDPKHGVPAVQDRAGAEDQLDMIDELERQCQALLVVSGPVPGLVEHVTVDHHQEVVSVVAGEEHTAAPGLDRM